MATEEVCPNGNQPSAFPKSTTAATASPFQQTQPTSNPTATSPSQPDASISEPRISILLTSSPLDPLRPLRQTRSPHAGANVLFLGTTRDTFDDRPVSHLSYSAYTPLALKTLHTIASDMLKKHALTSIAIEHRLGHVPVEEESIAIAVSAPHRKAAWRAGEECLEIVKEKAEVWKFEVFGDEAEGGEWRENRRTDGEGGVVEVEKKV